MPIEIDVTKLTIASKKAEGLFNEFKHQDRLKPESKERIQVLSEKIKDQNGNTLNVLISVQTENYESGFKNESETLE